VTQLEAIVAANKIFVKPNDGRLDVVVNGYTEESFAAGLV